ncbi:MAG: hypothetical protein ORN49_03255 [Rhodobacteraceae bacterium]|nr:hypothetical protein [Paracoccaceae bacterium]
MRIDVPRPKATPALLAGLVAVALTAGPILAHRFLPLVDLPNHIARHAIAADPDGPLSLYYQIGPLALPNSAVDMLWALLGHSGDVIRFSTYSFALYAALLIIATMVLGRVIWGRFSPWHAASGLFVYSNSFFWGFENFLFTIPFALLAMALWLVVAAWPTRFRLLIFLPVAAGIYFMHIFAFLGLAIAAVGHEGQALYAARGARWAQFRARLPMALPFALPIGWMVIHSPPGAHGITQMTPLLKRTEMLTLAFQAPRSDLLHPLNLSGYAVQALLLVLMMAVLLRRSKTVVLNCRMVGPLAALAAATLLSPTWLNGASYVHIRLPVLLFPAFLASTDLRALTARGKKLIALAVFSLMLTRGLLFERLAAGHTAEMGDLAATLAPLPPQSRLLAVRGHGNQWRDVQLVHAVAYAVVWQQAFVPTLFQGAHSLVVRPQWLSSTKTDLYAVDECRLADLDCDAPGERPEFIADWQRKFTHVLLEDKDPQFLGNIPALRRVAGQGRFTLYEVIPQP